VKQAQEYSDQDKRIKEKVETKNKADNLAYSAEKSLKDMGDKIDATQKQKIESAIKDLRESTKNEDEKDMQQKMDALTNMLHELSSKMYQDTASKGEQQPPPGSEGHQKKEEKKREGGDDGIIDADYEVKN
ncbi:MAG: Hsp70 family protein, partial [Planctomycetota bacterium]